jgi:spore coat polysaccharide biosynthesis protein SpsF
MRCSRHAGTIVVAIPDVGDQRALIEVCAELDIPVVRGPENDLLQRHLIAATSYDADVVVKVPSDCPLIDPSIMDLVIGVFLMNPNWVDFVSNLHPMSWPDGQDVEVVPVDVLEEAVEEATQPFEREHTTPFVWERSDRYRCVNVTWQRDLSDVYRLAVDYPEDLEVVRAVLDNLPSTASIDDIVDFLDRNPEVGARNAEHRGVNSYRHHHSELQTVGADRTRLAPGDREIGW